METMTKLDTIKAIQATGLSAYTVSALKKQHKDELVAYLHALETVQAQEQATLTAAHEQEVEEAMEELEEALAGVDCVYCGKHLNTIWKEQIEQHTEKCPQAIIAQMALTMDEDHQEVLEAVKAQVAVTGHPMRSERTKMQQTVELYNAVTAEMGI